MKKKIFIFLIVLVLNLCAFSQDKFPISSADQRFNPVYSENGIVATQDELASKIGASILKNGGNAVDAAVAVGYALAVTLPEAGNLGGGGFMIIWLAKEKKSVVINYREKAPLYATKDLFLDYAGKLIPDKSLHTYAATGVPGTVYGLNLALEKYGTMSLQEVMKPAIDLATHGFIVSHALSSSLERKKELLISHAASEKIFFRNKRVLQPGNRLIQKDLGETLKRIAKNGTKEFYLGQTARKIVSDMQKNAGLMTLEDLKKYTAEEQHALETLYHGKRILTVGPPSSGGATLIEMLNILENFDLNQIPFQSADYIHLLTEVANTAYFDRNNKLGDPNFVENSLSEMIDKKIALQKFQAISLNKHRAAKEIDTSFEEKQQNEKSETTHFSIMDKWGNTVANTYTLNGAYGNGSVVSGAGFFLNNEMDDFTSKPGVSNLFGLVQGEKNSIAPEKRPLSSMTPTILLNENNEPLFAIGSQGGSRIITQVLQFIIAVLDYHNNIATAVSLPKFHSQLWPDVLFYENGISPDTLALLRAKGHILRESVPFGSLQIAQKNKTNFFGASDPRFEGAAAFGFNL